MIGGVAKYFRFDWDYVLWGISYSNLTMLMATIPAYETDADKKEKAEEKETDLGSIFNDFK